MRQNVLKDIYWKRSTDSFIFPLTKIATADSKQFLVRIASIPVDIKLRICDLFFSR